MKLAIIGSRGLSVNITDFIFYFEIFKITEIISGGAKGIDTCAANFARENSIKLTEIKPDYKKFGRSAPIIRNKKIVEMADKVFAFWDGKSKGASFVINYAQKQNKPLEIIQIKQ